MNIKKSKLYLYTFCDYHAHTPGSRDGSVSAKRLNRAEDTLDLFDW